MVDRENEPPTAKEDPYGSNVSQVLQPKFDPYFNSNSKIIDDLLFDEEYYYKLPSYTVGDLQNDPIEMRRELLCWLREVVIHRCMDIEVLASAAQYVDRFVSFGTTTSENYQLIAATALLIASKIKEVSPLCIADIVAYCAHSITQQALLKSELILGNELDWDLSVISPLEFIKPTVDFLPFSNDNKEEVKLLATKLYLKIFPFEFLSAYKPRYIACACIIQAMQLRFNEEYNNRAEQALSTLIRLLKLDVRTLRESLNKLLSCFVGNSMELQSSLRYLDIDAEMDQSAASTSTTQQEAATVTSQSRVTNAFEDSNLYSSSVIESTNFESRSSYYDAPVVTSSSTNGQLLVTSPCDISVPLADSTSLIGSAEKNLLVKESISELVSPKECNESIGRLHGTSANSSSSAPSLQLTSEDEPSTKQANLGVSASFSSFELASAQHSPGSNEPWQAPKMFVANSSLPAPSFNHEDQRQKIAKNFIDKEQPSKNLQAVGRFSHVVVPLNCPLHLRMQPTACQFQTVQSVVPFVIATNVSQCQTQQPQPILKKRPFVCALEVASPNVPQLQSQRLNVPQRPIQVVGVCQLHGANSMVTVEHPQSGSGVFAQFCGVCHLQNNAFTLTNNQQYVTHSFC